MFVCSIPIANVSRFRYPWQHVFMVS